MEKLHNNLRSTNFQIPIYVVGFYLTDYECHLSFNLLCATSINYNKYLSLSSVILVIWYQITVKNKLMKSAYMYCLWWSSSDFLLAISSDWLGRAIYNLGLGGQIFCTKVGRLLCILISLRSVWRRGFQRFFFYYSIKIISVIDWLNIKNNN